MSREKVPKPPLHLVFGGELTDRDDVHLHRLLGPDAVGTSPQR